MSEIRRDPLFGGLSIIAQERASRPQRTKAKEASPRESAPCPLCPGNESLCPPELGRRKDQAERWLTRVFANRYPALTLEAEYSPKLGSPMPGFGVHEVAVDSANHQLPFWAMDAETGAALFSLLQERTRELYKDKRISHLQIFKNHMAMGGASLDHPHFQIVGLPFVSPGSERLFDRPTCGVCSVLNQEVRGKDSRILSESSRFIAYADYAPMFQYQFSIYPKEHAPAFEDASAEELGELAQISSLILGKMTRILGEYPLNLVIYNQPNPISFHRPEEFYPWDKKAHWFVRVFPRLGQKAGFEISTGVSVIHASPEDFAKLFREKGL